MSEEIIKNAMKDKEVVTAILAIVTTDDPDNVSINVKGNSRDVIAVLYHTVYTIANDLGIEVKDILKTLANLEVE